MKRNVIQSAFILFIFSLIHSCTADNTTRNLSEMLLVDYNNKQLKYSGRIDTSRTSGADMIWSGSSVKINFTGTSIAALLQDQRSDNYFNVILDNDSIFILRIDSTKRYHQLATNLKEGKHSIELFKRTEIHHGRTTLFNFRIKGKPELLDKPSVSNRKIEFYGNSITAGYGNEDYSGKDRPDSIFTNNYMSYAAITARHFGAEYHCIAKGGIGVMLSWFDYTMPDIYKRIDPFTPSSTWNFKQYTPNIVVINLFQNDSWLVTRKEHPEFIRKFGTEAPQPEYIVKSYKDFILKIRHVYPKAQIICALGCMDATREGSPWPAYVEQAVQQLQDDKIFTHFFPYQSASSHPLTQHHEKMAESLIHFISKNCKW